MTDIEIEIDGKVLKAKPNSMVIQVADEAGIYIPRFCYHKHLSVAANCRMCLVEVEKSPKTLPACATPVMPGMKVFTRSAKAIAAQKAVMEFLLINHPLDCPICDQGGECELQDISLGYGSANSDYTFGKRSVKDKDIGPLVATEMTRCIQCTRCVRFGDEVAGLKELGMTGRGEHSEIGTYVEKAMHSEVSGNIIDLCPVGALTSKPFRFSARAWELEQKPSIAPHDCLGSNINVHTRNAKVMRVVPRENVHINETWISDRDRYSYDGLYEDRVAKPKIRINNKLQETDWQTALEFITQSLPKVLNAHGPEQMGGLISPNATTEEFYLFQRLLRKLGCHNIDHRLRQADFSDEAQMPAFPGLTFSLDDIDKADRILLIGSNIQKEQPSAALRVRKATRLSAKVLAVNMMDYKFHFPVAHKKITAPHLLVNTLASVAKSFSEDHAHFSEINTSDDDKAFAELLKSGEKVLIILGAQALNHPQASKLRSLAKMLADHCNGRLGILTEGANASGAWLAGAVPHRGAGGVHLEKAGLSAQTMLQDPRKVYFLLNVEPQLDCASTHSAMTALEKAEFTVSFSIFNNPLIEKYADVILPITPFTETAGTFINAMGMWQSFRGVANPWEEARPAWKVLRVLGNFLHLEGFDYESAEGVCDEVKSMLQPIDVQYHFSVSTAHQKPENKLSRVGEIPIYAGDSLVRRSKPLQAAQMIIDGDVSVVRLHPETADRLAIKNDEIVYIKQQEYQVRLPALIDNRVPIDAAYIPGGISATEGLNELFGDVEIYR